MPLWKRSRDAQPPADAGESVAGFHDLRRIGRGGFSVVYHAYQERFRRVVALKVLAVEGVDSAVGRAFLREVELTSRLTGHPHVVTVLDCGTTAAGRPYIAMEFFERGSLADRLAAEGPLPVADVLRIGVKIAGALAAAHGEGILHRDVKPQNILISRYGEPALADFGTARLTSSLDTSSRVDALTPYHCAPEVLQGQAPTAAADVYSLGSTLYQLLTGRPPFAVGDGGIAALLLRVLHEEPPALERADVPPELAAALRRAMARDTADRFPDAWQLLTALQRIQASAGLGVTEVAGAAAPAAALPAEGGAPKAGPVFDVGRASVYQSPPAPDAVMPEDTAATTADVADPSVPPQQFPAEPAGLLPDLGVSQAFTAWDADVVEPPAPPRAETAAPPHPAPARIEIDDMPVRPRRKPVALLAGVLLIALLAIGTPLLLSVSGPGHGAAGATATPPGAAATTAIGASPAAAPSRSATAGRSPSQSGSDLATFAPTDVSATLSESTVLLHWRLAPGTQIAAVVVFKSPRDANDPGAYSLDPGTTSDRLTVADPRQGYCFWVGVSVRDSSGNYAIARSAQPSCVNGASPAA